MRMQRIQVRRRRFGFKAGNSFVAVKEYAKNGGGARAISFIAALPDEFNRKALRELILRRIEGATDEGSKS